MSELDILASAVSVGRAIVFNPSGCTVRIIRDPHPWHPQKTVRVDGRKTRHAGYWPTKTGWSVSLTPEAS